jgi:hypothetical protein
MHAKQLAPYRSCMGVAVVQVDVKLYVLIVLRWILEDSQYTHCVAQERLCRRKTIYPVRISRVW